MNQEDQRLDHKQSLKKLATRLKQVLNPKITKDDYTGKSGIKLITDIQNQNEFNDIISFSVKCLCEKYNDKKSIYTIGYFENNNFYVTNLSSGKISKIGLYLDDVYNILLIPDDNTILETEAEVFITSENEFGNKNHITSIEYITEGEYEEYLQDVSEGELDFRFKYTIQTDENSTRDITEGVISEDIVDRIFHSTESTELTHHINITINGGDSHEEGELIYGEGSLDTTDGVDNDIELTVDVESITNSVADSIREDVSQVIPDASTTEKGVIALAKDSENIYPLGDNKLPLQTITVNQLPRAYVDVTEIYDKIEQDVHRYSDMNEASRKHRNVGDIVQYIGTTNSEFVHGYFYMRTRELLAAEFKYNSRWTYSDNTSFGRNAVNDAITEYNKQNDHLLNTACELVITPNLSEPCTITNSTEFTVTNCGFSDVLTYDELLSFGIELQILEYNGMIDEFTARFSLSYVEPEDSNPRVWVQKNVQPPINMQSALKYKGVCTWEQLQEKTSISQPGDFWTVSDRSNQEYFFTNENTWEFMGDVFTNNGSYSVNTKIGSADPQTVSTFEANQSGNTNVTFIQGNNVILEPDIVNHTVTISHNDTSSQSSVSNTGRTYIQSISLDGDGHVTELISATETVVNVKSDWNASSGADSEILNKPSLATVATSGSYNDLLDKPSIPSAQVNSDWNANSGVEEILNKPNLAQVATSGSYNDLINTPTIPAAQVQSDWNATSGMGEILNKPTLAIVATSGSYTDLSNTPTIPAAQINSDWNSTSGVSEILNKPSLAAVATSGSYSDLSGTPTIPTVNDATYSVKTEVNGTSTTVSDFTANQSSADDVTFVQGTNITLTPDATNKKITINSANTTYQLSSTTSGTNGNTKVILTPSSGTNDEVTIEGTGLMSVTSDANGKIQINTTATDNVGTVTSISTGAGLTTSDGNSITSFGTIKAKLKSESLVNLTAALGDTPNRQYAVELDKDGYLSVNAPWQNSTYSFSQSGNTLTITPSDGSTATTYTPTLNQVNSDWNASSGVAQILNKPTIPSVSTVSNYITVDGNGGGTNINNYVPVGSVQMYAGSTAPSGWLLCNGRNITNGSTYASLRNIIGTTYNIDSSKKCKKSTVYITVGSSIQPYFVYLYENGDWAEEDYGNNLGLNLAINPQSASISQGSTVYVRLMGQGDFITATVSSAGSISDVDVTTLNLYLLPDFQQKFPLGAGGTGSTLNAGKDSNGQHTVSTVIGSTGGQSEVILAKSQLASHSHSLTNIGTSQSAGGAYSYSTDAQSGTYAIDTSSAGSDYAHNNMPPFIAINFIIKY